jgi:queuine tRNA-ribosyltransferase
MGVGTPPQLLKMIAAGADMFDCVMPTREARHGIAFTEKGKINLKNAKYKLDERPLFDEFTNNEIGKFSRAYIRHLIISGEILGGVLLTLHNVRFYLHLMSLARQHIENNTFAAWHRDWIDRYIAGTQGYADSQK